MLAQWHVRDYPGPHRLLASVTGWRATTVHRRMTDGRMTPAVAERLALYLEQHSAEALAVAAELRTYTKLTRGRVKTV